MKKVIFEKEYYGFESTYDLERDISEAFESLEDDVSDEFTGTIKVVMTYEEEEEEE